MYGNQAANLFLDSLPEESQILDIGSGEDGNGFGKMCRKAGHVYVPFDLAKGNNWESPHDPIKRRGRHYDGVYMCHSLEHMLDTHAALTAIHSVLKQRGVLAITVPPLKHSIVGGHVSLWNPGLLLYRLILAGFDCSLAAVKTYEYNISVVVRRVPIELPPKLKHDNGDINALRAYFPQRMGVGDGFDGQIKEYQWKHVLG